MITEKQKAKTRKTGEAVGRTLAHLHNLVVPYGADANEHHEYMTTLAQGVSNGLNYCTSRTDDNGKNTADELRRLLCLTKQ